MESKRAKAIWAKLGDHCQLYRKSRRAQLATWGRESRNLCSGKLHCGPVRSHGPRPLFHNGQRGSTATFPSAESHLGHPRMARLPRSWITEPRLTTVVFSACKSASAITSVWWRNYTYSHCIDNGESGSVYAASGWLTMSQPQQIGNCSFGRRNQLTFNGVYRSPEFHSRVMEAILGHWQVAPIVTYLSGGWLTVTTGVDTALVGIATSVPNGGQPANLVPGQPVYVPQTIISGSVRGKYYFNPSAFAVPTAPPGFTGNVINAGNGPITVGPLGNVGRDSLLGPSVHSFDLALTRIFKINERNEIDARFEAFNVLNLVNLSNPFDRDD